MFSPPAAARSPGVQGPTSCGPRPLSLSGVVPRSVRTGLPSQISALGAGTPARCPGVPTRPLPAPLSVPAPRAKDPSYRRLGSCQGPRATFRAASAQQEQCRLSRWRSRPSCRPPRLCRCTPRGLRRGAVAAQRCSATPSFGPRGPSWPHGTDPSFMLQCRNISATEGEKRPRSQTKHKNWCVTHLLGYLQSPNCLPGVFLAEAGRCLSLFFPGKKMD
nr:uncharacterized protein LOC110585075 [Neomonachus schauinslandi]